MARPREFNESEALGDAMQLFWQCGYENASLSEITRATGLSKSSLYGTFGSKHELLLSSLQYYFDNLIEPSFAVLDEGPSPRAAIAKRFDMIIKIITAPGQRHGCFLANSTLEFGARDAAVAEKIKMAQGKMERAYIRVIERGKTAGEIDPNKDAQTLARYIMACLAGIVCLSKSGYDAATLNDISVTAMQAVT